MFRINWLGHAVCVVILGTLPVTAYADLSADATYWQGPVNSAADWFSGSNWDKGVPDSSDVVAINNRGIAQITSGTAVAGSLYLAPATTVYPTEDGHLIQSGGSLTISNKLEIRRNSSYILNDGDLSSQDLVVAGNFFQQSGGSNSTDNMSLYSNYKLESGTLTVTGDEDISCNGIFEQTGGNHVANYIVLGDYAFGGHYVLSGGTLDASSLQGTNSSTVEHTGGSSVLDTIWGVGSYNLSQANVNIPSSLTTIHTNVGAGQTFTQSGGVHTCSDTNIWGEYTLSGGTHTVGDELFIVGDGTYKMTDGALTASHVSVGVDYNGGGTLEVASGCTVSVKGTNPYWLHHNTIHTFGNGSVDLTQGGKVFIGDVDTGIAGTITIGTDGALEGTGTIIGDVYSQGIVRSGWVSGGGFYIGEYSPGTLTITGDYEQESNGILALFMAGSDADSFSRISIGGQADIAGELSLSLIDGFIPNIGDTFEILESDLCYGNFSLLNVIGLPDDMFFDIEYGSDNVVLHAVPEPATLSLLSLGWLTLLRRHELTGCINFIKKQT